MTIAEASATSGPTLDQTSYTLLDSMTLTPGEGEYLCVLGATMQAPDPASTEILNVAIFVDGVIQAQSEREVVADGSIDGADLPISTNAHVTVGAGEVVDIRYKLDVTRPWIARPRTLNLFPAVLADISEANATANTTTSSASYVLLDSMTLTPGAGDYLLVFSTSVQGADDAELAFAVFVGGSIVPHTERTTLQESSIVDTPVIIALAAHVSPTAGQDVEIRWQRQSGSGTIETQERTLTLLKTNVADIFEASATADQVDTNTTDALLNGMTLTPGAGDYLGLFSTSQFFGSISTNQDVRYTAYVNGSAIPHTERHVMHESSIDNADLSTGFVNGVLSPADAQDVEIQWRNSTTTSRTARERTLVLLREAIAAPAGNKYQQLI